MLKKISLVILVMTLLSEKVLAAKEDRPVVFSEDPLVFKNNGEHTVVLDIEYEAGVCWVQIDFIQGETDTYYDIRSDMTVLKISIGGKIGELFPELKNETFTILEIEDFARKKCWPNDNKQVLTYG